MTVTWKDGTQTGRQACDLEDELLANVLYPEDFGGVGGGALVDNKNALEAACDAARGFGTVVSLCRNPPYYFSNLRVSANMTLKGPNMNTVSLARLPGSTGIAVREKTLAEGNAAGATGLWIRDVSLRGYLSTDPGAGGIGDQGTYGFNIGSQVANAQLNFNSGMENVHVRNFVSGTGMLINQNAAKCSYLWALNNSIGIQTSGGASSYDGIWAEGNTTRNLIIGGNADTYTHVQTEESSTNEAILFTGAANRLIGAWCSLGANKTGGVVKIDLAAGGSSNSIYGLRISPNGFTYPNGIYIPAYSAGTGPSQQIIPWWIDANSTNYGWYFDSFNGNSFQINGTGLVGVVLPAFGPTYSASITIDRAVASWNNIVVTNANAITMNPPINGVSGEELTVNFQNLSGGAMGVITWNASYPTGFKLVGGATGLTGPANNKYSAITFEHNGAVWIEKSRAENIG